MGRTVDVWLKRPYILLPVIKANSVDVVALPNGTTERIGPHCGSYRVQADEVIDGMAGECEHQAMEVDPLWNVHQGGNQGCNLRIDVGDRYVPCSCLRVYGFQARGHHVFRLSQASLRERTRISIVP
ncbi:hypothetical protein D3C72_984470 [compost metagenome]